MTEMEQQVKAENEKFDNRLQLLSLSTEIRILISIECDLKKRRLNLMTQAEKLQAELDGQTSLFK